jgi:hypothetical protein
MGGNAIKCSSRINQENIEETIIEIKKMLYDLDINENNIAVLGSASKKLPGETSGDIDIAININALPVNSYDYLIDYMSKKVIEYKDMRSMGIISIAFPIKNIDLRQINKFVQVDFMLVDSIEWASWAFYSPSSKESPWKGLYRNEILYSIAKHMNFEFLDFIDSLPVSWKRNFFDLSKGLLTGTQTIKGKKSILKTAKTLEKTLISKDPDEVVKMMFNEDLCKDDVLTWESTFKHLISDDFKYKNNLLNILKMTKEGITRKGYPVPIELDQFFT